MKKIFVMVTVIAGLLFSTNLMAEGNSDIITSRLPAKLHVIQNFEDWNDVLIRFTGVLKNSCYTKESTNVRVDGNQILIENNIKFSGGQNCLMFIKPYSDQVAVRNLKEGMYDVLVMDKTGQYQEMTSFMTE
jgi:hypothetical protein